MKSAVWGMLGLLGPLLVFAAGKSALWDHDSWTIWLPVLGCAVLVFSVLAFKRRSA